MAVRRQVAGMENKEVASVVKAAADRIYIMLLLFSMDSRIYWLGIGTDTARLYLPYAHVGIGVAADSLRKASYVPYTQSKDGQEKVAAGDAARVPCTPR
ncbi:hypothetical protein HJFPF1_04877 [Paramyrothecium foliicola]|nr:hypothetical protein HJFPF1_04877 [Paramyrothecium foliicola]